MIVCRSLHPAILTGERGRFCVIAAAYGIVLCADGADGGHSGAGVLGRHRYHLRGQRRAAGHPNHRITPRPRQLPGPHRPSAHRHRYHPLRPLRPRRQQLLRAAALRVLPGADPAVRAPQFHQPLFGRNRPNRCPGQCTAAGSALPYAAQPYCCAPAGLPRPGRPRRHRAGTRLGRCAGKLLRPDRSRLPDHRPRTAAGHRHAGNHHRAAGHRRPGAADPRRRHPALVRRPGPAVYAPRLHPRHGHRHRRGVSQRQHAGVRPRRRGPQYPRR